MKRIGMHPSEDTSDYWRRELDNPLLLAFMSPLCHHSLQLGASSKLKNGKKRPKRWEGVRSESFFKVFKKEGHIQQREGGYDVLSSF